MATGSIARRTTFPPGTFGFAAAIFVIGGFGPNSMLAALAIAVLVTGVFLLWRPGESGILLFVFGFQWMQASIGVFYANWLDIDVIDFSEYGSDFRLATILSLLGLIALALGMRLGAGPWRQQDGAVARTTSSHFAPRYWFWLYAAAFAVATLAQFLASMIPGLSQPLIALASLKWAFYWLLAYATFAQSGASRQYWLVALTLELMLGIGGYFSDFKTPLIFTFLAVVAAGARFSIRQYLSLLSLAAIALTMGLVWTAVKIDYRKFVRGGEVGQVVTVPYLDRMTGLAQMVGQLDDSDLADAWDSMVRRITYVDFFGVVLDRVPAALPHEDGALWRDAVTRPFMPRIFFPAKTTIEDSERTVYYTGIWLAGAEQGTSISIGYMGESYIDFGAAGMMILIFGFGLLLGGFYRGMIRLDHARLLGMSLATATIFGAVYLETSITKMFGGIVVAMLVSWLVLRFAPRYLPLIYRKMVC
jgi:hypothetical protein